MPNRQALYFCVLIAAAGTRLAGWEEGRDLDKGPSRPGSLILQLPNELRPACVGDGPS